MPVGMSEAEPSIARELSERAAGGPEVGGRPRPRPAC